MANKVLWLSISFAAIVLVGCTARSGYEGLRERHRQECNKLPNGDRSECLAQTGEDYEAYKRKRDAAVGNN